MAGSFAVGLLTNGSIGASVLYAVPVLSIVVLLVFWRAGLIGGPSSALQRGDFETAKQLYEKAIEENQGPQAWKLYLGLAQCQLQLCKPEAALELCDRAIAIAPNQGLCYQARAQAASDCNRYQDSLADCQKAVSLGCAEKFVCAIRAAANFGIKKFDEALADCDRLRTFSRDRELIAIYVLRSVIDGYKGNFDQAIEHCDAALRIDPNNVITLNNRGHYYTALGQLDKAHTDFQSAELLQMPPRIALHLMCGKSQLALKEGDVELALRYANQAVEQRPNSPCALFAHAVALTRKGDAQGALIELDRAISIDAYSAEAYWARSKAHEALSQTDKAEEDKREYERLGYRPYL
jgi:tetratricopeptide (TPR) repeat protein